ASAAQAALAATPSTSEKSQIEVHDLSGALKANNLTYPKAAGHMPRIERISFYLEPGTCLAILGESGSGKTTLLNALSGIDPAPIGNCFLDETDVRTIDQTHQTDVIGYVPQNTVLNTGTIAENIARFTSQIDDDLVIAASKLAGVHGAISALPAAYHTDLAKEPYALSAGQQQRIAFARAIYEQPRYLFLDEPNALLDHQSERALGDALVRLKSMGTTIVMTAHRMSIVQLADKVAVMEQGRLIDFGPKAEILGKMTDNHRRIRVGVQDGALQDLCDYVARQFVRGGDEELRQRAIKVATELFNFAKGNGTQTADRSLHFAFKFIDDDTCSITLSEYRSTKLEAKIKKVRDASKDALPTAEILSEDELSLAQVMKLSDSLQHKSDQGETALCARITHLPSPETRLQ
ncbi:MAG: ATP-binding cassette domain-containing protein, partial [Pseudomonadota bacterium]